jgi:hypothetical protein
MLNRLFALLVTGVFSFACHALDTGNESTADKADHFHFEEFHNEKSITLWEDKKDKAVTNTISNADSAKTDATKNDSGKNVAGKSVYEKGDILKVREPYKLGSDPGLRDIQGLFDATEALHKQLNHFCPNGWQKTEEWHKPGDGHFYIYYQAVCL